MANLKHLFLATLLLTCFGMGGCNKIFGTKDELPDATQEGKNTFGCMVNGQLFIPKKRGLGLSPTYECSYQYLDDGFSRGYVLTVSARNLSVDCNLRSVIINTDSLGISEGATIRLESLKRGAAGGRYLILTCGEDNEYKTSGIASGELKITRFDDNKQIVAGTFWFTAVNKVGDTVKVSDGRFDMKFTQ